MRVSHFVDFKRTGRRGSSRPWVRKEGVTYNAPLREGRPRISDHTVFEGHRSVFHLFFMINLPKVASNNSSHRTLFFDTNI